MQTKQTARRYRVAMANGFGIDLSEEYATAADADRASDEIKGGHHWVEVFNEKDGQWWLLHYDSAIFQDSGRDILIDIDGTGRWELFSTCANQHDARNMAKHYQEQHNPQH
jgi:hypothetical protein